MENKQLNEKKIALYIRLSRDDGDRAESLSITNQRLLLTEFVKNHPDLSETEIEEFVDDGFTGTNFDRPAFKRLCSEIKARKIKVVIVKDLSRLGRNLSKSTEYVQEYFPSQKVRFIAIDDSIDKQYFDVDTSEDMMIDIKNMFNGFYPKDISKKVRSTIRMKQGMGQFIGAFASYGYLKSPDDHNQLIVDETASENVKRIFSMFISGQGMNTIAETLNAEGIPCPTEYKRQQGLNYKGSSKPDETMLWSAKGVKHILQNRMYTGDMVQNTHVRQICKKKAVELPEEQWLIVPNTHDAIIEPEVFEKVQKLIGRKARQSPNEKGIHNFAGFMKCGDCGNTMVRITRGGVTTFSCGTYNKHGNRMCSAHLINESTIEEIIRNDLNAILASFHDIKDLVQKEQERLEKADIKRLADAIQLENEVQAICRKKADVYDDYINDLISKQEYLKHKEKFEQKMAELQEQIEAMNKTEKRDAPSRSEWIERLLEIGYIEKLDRLTVVEMVNMIYIYADNTIKIIYNFSDELEDLIQAS